MSKAITNPKFTFPGQEKVYHGKVRDVYYLENNLLLMVASDRISAFDVILPEGIPFKGSILNAIAAKFLDATSDICPNWLMATPAPQIAIGHKCEPFKVEMVIRGYLTGHAWRTYKSGARMLCGVTLPEGMQEHDRFPNPIITPATKAEEGHDEDISREEILAQGIVPKEMYETMERYTRELFQRGTEMAAQKGLILVDTKYEFGLFNGAVMLMDEIHTPDSSRYFYAAGYAENQAKGEAQKQLSKEFVREWLIANDFQGKDGQQIPAMSEQWVQEISKRYIELYETITGDSFKASEHLMESSEAYQASFQALLALGHKA